VDGTLGTFRPIDDLFEEAAMRLTRDVVSSSKQDPTAAVSEQDVIAFSRLDCVLAAVPSVCEVKGTTGRSSFPS
jgi:ribonuclease H2 subunit B